MLKIAQPTRDTIASPQRDLASSVIAKGAAVSPKGPKIERPDVQDEKPYDDVSLVQISTAQSEPHMGAEIVRTASTGGPLYSVFTKNQKRFIVAMASWAGFFSPVSSSIYFPALNSLARDLHVTSTLINLTLTSFMVCV